MKNEEIQPPPGGEEAFLSWLRQQGAGPEALEVPIGDDAAVWRLPSGERLVAAADALAEGTHFDSQTPPEAVGRKALLVNLSDLAAMGATPLFATATAALPRGFDAELPRRLHAGLSAAARRWSCPLVGGDTLSHEGGLVLSVSVTGVLDGGEAILRSGASPGDLIAVTGALGGSFISGRHLDFIPRLRESRALRTLGPPSAMMDLSDGLLLDLSRLCDASEVGFSLDLDAIPLHPDCGWKERGRREALADGEDFELVFCAAPAAMDRIFAGWELETPLCRVGQIMAPGTREILVDGYPEPAQPRGFEHR